MDLKSFYTILPHNLGLEAVSHFLIRDSSLLPIQKEFILNLLKFVATNNYFWFGGKLATTIYRTEVSSMPNRGPI